LFDDSKELVVYRQALGGTRKEALEIAI
jgi:hypothetical protein